MKNYVQPGNVVSLPAPYDVPSGGGLLVGALFGVATVDATTGNPVETAVDGVFDLAKVPAQAWTVGVKIYWADGPKQATTTATGNTLIGAAIASAANPSESGRVRLNGAAA